MRAKFGRGPTVVSKKGSLKFISRYEYIAIISRVSSKLMKCTSTTDWHFKCINRSETYTLIVSIRGCRYQHAAVCVPTLHAMYVFGGLGASGAIAEMWKYNVDSGRWSKLQVRTTM